MPLLAVGLGVVLALAATWALFVGALIVARPKGLSLSDTKRFVPDIVRVVRDLVSDLAMPKGVRRRLSFLLAYLMLPFDLVPDFVPVLGYADDVIVVALVFRSVVRRAGPDAVDQHWRGTPQGLKVLHRLCGMNQPA